MVTGVSTGLRGASQWDTHCPKPRHWWDSGCLSEAIPARALKRLLGHSSWIACPVAAFDPRQTIDCCKVRTKVPLMLGMIFPMLVKLLE